MLTNHILCETWNVTFSLEGSSLFSGMWLILLLGFQRGALKNNLSSILFFCGATLTLSLILLVLLDIFLFLHSFLNHVFHAAWRPFILEVCKCFPFWQRDQFTFMVHTTSGPSGRKVTDEPRALHFPSWRHAVTLGVTFVSITWISLVSEQGIFRIP